MKNTKILSLIFKKTNSLITSDEYKEAYSLGKSFSRNRKLSFSNTIHFICSGLRKSISTEIDKFIEEYPYLKFPSISKQEFSKARQNISPEAFKELGTLFVNEFYSLKKDLRTWNGFNVLAVDGTNLQVPNTCECSKYFGFSSNQNKTITAMALASALYDVLNDIIIDARITRYKTSERAMAEQHIDSMIAALIKQDADTAIADDNKDKPLNLIYQSNRNFILALVFKRFIPLLVKSRLRKKY
ncbi:hypothetical protein [Clostridium sp.]|uniref:hypothetical protein n=1 Tax=Clostridium sp. TaxID=1506 RepID=UPI0032170404